MGAALAAGLLAVLSAVPAGAAQPRIYHTITSSHGFAFVDRTEGCERIEVFVSSSFGSYAGQPGPVNKQGLTGVFVRVTDVCATEPSMSAGPRPAAGGGGGGLLFEAEGQNQARLVTDNRLRGAGVSTAIPATDSNGDPLTVHLTATWRATGPLTHTTTNTHANLGAGNVSSTANELERPVAAQMTVSAAGYEVSGHAAEATLTQSKFRCVEVPRPGVEEFYPCFGFPG
ncbi:hypothetical protein IDVR_13160 [Intrasporangium sp. DVR]